jgi:hypothetical protein
MRMTSQWRFIREYATSDDDRRRKISLFLQPRAKDCCFDASNNLDIPLIWAFLFAGRPFGHTNTTSCIIYLYVSIPDADGLLFDHRPSEELAGRYSKHSHREQTPGRAWYY